MADSSWDNGGRPPAKKGLSPLAMVVIGTSLGILLLLLAAAGWGASVIWKTNQSRTSELEQAWGIIRKDLQQLESEVGAKAFYRENPGLAGRYPTEEAFLKACAGWKPKLQGFPEKAPDVLNTPGLEFSAKTRGQKDIYLSYHLPKGGLFRFASLDDRVVGLSVE